MEQNGVVLFGANNIYTVLIDGKNVMCRIKGKVLHEDEHSYNPVAAGDTVKVMPDPLSAAQGWITARGERKNGLIRWNKKKKSPQIIAANVDCLAAVCSFQSPPFRPRFLDRLIILGQLEGIAPVIVANKCDLETDDETEDRLSAYEKNGYRIIRSSVKTGQGIDELLSVIRGKCTVFAGQSGVGKSSLLNVIEPELKLKVGEISSKYDRGIHTTGYSIMVTLDDHTRFIDTPGIRECFIYNLDPDQLRFYFPEFAQPSKECGYSSCMHTTEPDCKVRVYAEQGRIHPDRYESYLRILQTLNEQENM
jgi:ribosome biogenesis GTPase